MTAMIECTLVEMRQYAALISSNNKKTKHGLYLSAIYHNIKGFGAKSWVVAVNINLDYEKHASEGKNLEEIARGCVEYLNTPPKSKYGKRRKRKPLYGAFRDEPYRTYLKKKNDKKYIQALLIVNDRKRKCFWGEGEKLSLKR